MPRPYDPLFLARLHKPREGQPVCQILYCQYLRTDPRGRYVLRHGSTKFGIRAYPAQVHTDPVAAQRTLSKLVQHEISAHVAAIRRTKAAFRIHNANPLIIYANAADAKGSTLSHSPKK